MRRFHAALLGALALGCLVTAGFATAGRSHPNASAGRAAGCQLSGQGNDIQHVIYIQFDNTHFRRDNPNVPSDLEQMPNLLNFMRDNGTLLTRDHTVLISHTATGILTSLTGVYPDRMGQPVSNSYRYFSGASSNTGVSFAYWTDPVFDPANPNPTDTTPTMINEKGKIAPAPWVPYTRAGCNFGAVATANTVLENIATDIPTVFGPNSPEAQEVKDNPGQAFADFVGLTVHCAQGDTACAHFGKDDKLPDEPGGYNGFQALYGAKYVAARLSPSEPLKDIDGNVIKDPQGRIGFPGFDGMSASVSLGLTAFLQEHGVPVTYAYISDAHDNHPTGPAFGPGQAGYVAALKAYNDAFGKFFARLANDGITKKNTLFVFTVDEGDHFVGGLPDPPGCDGVTTPCTYSQIGEINTNLAGLLATERGNTTPFKVHSDSAPAVYIDGNPAQTAPVTRTLERDVSALTALNPITNATDFLTRHLADRTEQNLLHMITADPLRTPTFIMFADPNYFLFAGAPNCTSPCVTVNPAFAWNHGDDTPEIMNTWLGFVGPGVQHEGIDSHLWSDHTDVRPTILSLAGLKDDYEHDGRVLAAILDKSAVPKGLRTDVVERLGAVYKQLDAPYGKLARASMQISTVALKSNTPNDATYTRLESDIAAFTTKRNALANQIQSLLEGAAFGGQTIDESQARSLIQQSEQLIGQVVAEASNL